MSRRRPAVPTPPGPRLDELPTDPQGEPSTLRCHWANETDPESGQRVLSFIPGCSTMLFDPENGQCLCDTIAHRLAVQVAPRRDCDEEITALRDRLRVWSRAGAAAYTVLTGRDTSGYIHPEDLARAVRKAA